MLECSRREPATRLVGLEAKNFVPQQQAWYLLTGGGWFSCSWKLHELIASSEYDQIYGQDCCERWQDVYLPDQSDQGRREQRIQ